jgi:hypothetical protein
VHGGKVEVGFYDDQTSKNLTKPEIAGNTQAAPMRQIIIGADNQLLLKVG